MLYWQNIMQIVILAINSLYLLSLIITWKFYPAQPIHDLETDEIIGHYQGLTKWHFIWLIPFSLITNWGYKQINEANKLGIKPGFCLDLFGLNLFA